MACLVSLHLLPRIKCFMVTLVVFNTGSKLPGEVTGELIMVQLRCLVEIDGNKVW